MKVNKIYYLLFLIVIAGLHAPAMSAENGANPVQLKLSTRKSGFESRSVLVASFTNVSGHEIALFMPSDNIQLNLIVDGKKHRLHLKKIYHRKIISFLVLYPGERRDFELYVEDNDLKSFPSGKYQLEGRYTSAGLNYLTGRERVGLRSVYGAHHEPSFETYEYPVFLQGLLSYRVVRKSPEKFELVLFCKKEAVKNWELVTETNSSTINVSLTWSLLRVFGWCFK